MSDSKANDAVAELSKIASELGCTPSQLAIAWCAHNPHVSTVITGASRLSQVQENMEAVSVLATLESEPAIVERLDRAFKPVAR